MIRLISLITLLCAVHNPKANTIATYNIRNFDYDQRAQIQTNKPALYKTLKEMKADLISVQEIREKKIFKDFIDESFKNYDVILSECGGSHDQHLGFVYNKDKFKLLKFEEDLRVVNPRQPNQTYCGYGSRPIAIAKFMDLKTQKVFHALSIHLKSGGRPDSIKKRFKQLELLKVLVKEMQDQGNESFIIMGDFNSTEYNARSGNYNKFKNIIDSLGLIDLSQKLKCTSYWWGGINDGKNYPSLLDHVIVSPDFFKSRSEVISHCKKLRCNETLEFDMGVSFDEVSDHCPQVAEIK